MDKRTKLFAIAFVTAGIFSTNSFCMDLSKSEMDLTPIQYEKLEAEYNELGKKWDNDLSKITWKNEKLIKNTYDYQEIIDYEKGCYKENNNEINHDGHEEEFAKTVNAFFLLQKKINHHKKRKEEEKEKTVKTTNSWFSFEFVKSLNPLSALKSFGSFDD